MDNQEENNSTQQMTENDTTLKFQGNTVKLIIIKPNEFEFKIDLYHNQLDKLKSDLVSCVEETDVKFEDMMETIVTSIKLTPEYLGETSVFYENSRSHHPNSSHSMDPHFDMHTYKYCIGSILSSFRQH